MRGGDSGRDVIYSPALAAIKFRERKSCVGRWGRTEEGLSQRMMMMMNPIYYASFCPYRYNTVVCGAACHYSNYDK